MIVCAALVVPPDSNVYVPQELVHRRVGLDYGNGTAYAGLQMLEGAVPRDAIATCADVRPGHTCGVSFDNLIVSSVRSVP